MAEDCARSADLPWEARIINTSQEYGRGIHWIRCMWCVKRGRLVINLWEPYAAGHDKVSRHVPDAFKEAFPGVIIYTYEAGEQPNGDGWSCGYICA